MNDQIRMTFDDDELFTIEQALTCYKTMLDGFDDGRTVLNGAYGRTERLLQRIRKALGDE